jgi:hypothetical protein
MKKFEVSFRPRAEADLLGLYEYVAEEAGHETAGAISTGSRKPAWHSKHFPSAVRSETISVEVSAR